MSAAPASINVKDLYAYNVKLCYPFIEAVLNTLRVQCSIDGRAGKPSFKSAASEGRTDVLISFALATPDTIAAVSLCFTKSVFLKVMGKMFGEIYSEITPELQDGAKELMNIVFNQARKPLQEKGLAAMRSIPQIICADNLQISYMTSGQSIVLPMDTDVGSIELQITSQSISGSETV